MWFFLISNLHAHTPSTTKWAQNISLGYQYRTMVPEERFTTPHCSVLQYGGVFTLSSNDYLNAIIEPRVGIVGLNQSVLQPVASMILGFQFGESFTIGSGPLISTREDQDNTFFPQIIMEISFLLHIDQSILPIKIGYVPTSHGLTQYQLLLGYTWN